MMLDSLLMLLTLLSEVSLNRSRIPHKCLIFLCFKVFIDCYLCVIYFFPFCPVYKVCSRWAYMCLFWLLQNRIDLQWFLYWLLDFLILILNFWFAKFCGNQQSKSFSYTEKGKQLVLNPRKKPGIKDEGWLLCSKSKHFTKKSNHQKLPKNGDTAIFGTNIDISWLKKALGTKERLLMYTLLVFPWDCSNLSH